MILAALFAIFFIGGPLVFWGFTRSEPSDFGQWVLGTVTALMAGMGMFLRYGFADLWGRHVVLTVLSLALIWLAWIGVLAFGAQALRRVHPGRQMRRWSGIIGAGGTTMPWFGLASANLVQG
ncbi:MAG: hypothetical protein AB8B60_11010 [Sulfitobacter sp.]